MKMLQYFEERNAVHVQVKDEDGAIRWIETTTPSPIYVKCDPYEGAPQSIYGDSLKEMHFDDIRHVRKFMRQVPEARSQLYGTSKMAYSAVTHMNFEPAVLEDYVRCMFDIETECENGFPEPSVAEEQVNMITLKCSNKEQFDVFTTCEVDPEEVASRAEIPLELLNITVFETERSMLKAYVQYFRENSVVIYSGWNSERFDVYYMCNRIKRILGQEWLERMSPFGQVEEREYQDDFGRDAVEFKIRGLIHIDSQVLYKKRVFGSRENYTLDFIAKTELGAGKLEHESGVPGHMLYTIGEASAGLAYNIVDVQRLEQIVDKTKIFDLEVTLAQMCNINLEDTEFVTRIIIGYLYTFLRDRNMYFPFATDELRNYKIEGGFVPEPVIGRHKYIISADLASSYPSSMRAVNISPETKGPLLKHPSGRYWHDDDFMRGEYPEEAKDPEFREKYTIAPNGQCFVRDHRGMFPLMLDELYAKRNEYKAEANRLKAEAAACEDAAEKKKLESRQSQMKMFDLAVKLILNSVYGAMASDKFLFFDPDVAGAVTATGRIALKRMIEYTVRFASNEKNMLKSLEMFCKALEKDTDDYPYKTMFAHLENRTPDTVWAYREPFEAFSAAGDTDSTYMSMEQFVRQLHFHSDKMKNEEARLEFCTWFGDNILQKAINKAMAKVEEDTNALVSGVIKADREVVAAGAIWTAKKKYSLLAYDVEGAKFWPEMYAKTQGLSLIQRVTSQKVKDALKEFLKLVLTQEPQDANKFILDFKKEFVKCPVDDIAQNMSANDFQKFVNDEGKPQRVINPESGKWQSPSVAPRGAITYNWLVRKHGKERSDRILENGDSFRVVRLSMPNPAQSDVVAWPDEWPKFFDDLGLRKYVDERTQFEKSFYRQATSLFDAMDFNYKVKEELDLL